MSLGSSAQLHGLLALIVPVNPKRRAPASVRSNVATRSYETPPITALLSSAYAWLEAALADGVALASGICRRLLNRN